MTGAVICSGIHKPVDGFQLELVRMGKSILSLIQGEMAVLEYLAQYPALGTQQVYRNSQGQAVTRLRDGTPVTVLGWLEGETLENVSMTESLAYRLGEMIGRLHNVLSGMPRQVVRYGYDSRLLTSMLRETARARANGTFDPPAAGCCGENTDIYAELHNRIFTILFQFAGSR